MILTVYLFVSYLVGSLPSGILLRRAAGLSARQIGALSFVLDFLKGFVPVLFAHLYWPDDAFAASLGALFAVTGHCYSVFLFFRGGKGVSTTAGALFPLAPLAMLIALAAGGLGLYAFRLNPLAAMIAILALPIALLLVGVSAPVLSVAAICGVMVVRRHQEDLAELLGAKTVSR